MSKDDVSRFIEVVSGTAPPPRLVDAVQAQVEGNPLFLTEVVRLLVQEGRLSTESLKGQEGWTITIPESARGAIGRRLARVSAICNETLTTAAIIGREFSLSQLDSLLEALTEDELLDIIDEAQAARLIEEMPQEVDRYRFSHALVQRTLGDQISATRKRRLHSRIATMLEEVHGAELEAHSAELAYHFRQAGGVAGNQKLLVYSILAGESALKAHAYEEALDHFEAGLAVIGEQGLDAQAAQIFYGLGRAQASIGQLADAVTSLTKAFDAYEAAGDVRMAVAVAQYPIIALPGITGLASLIERALRLVAPDSIDEGLLLSRQIRPLSVEYDDYDGAQRATSKALSIARGLGDQGLEARTLSESADVDGHNMSFEDALTKSEQALELAQALSDPHTASVALYWSAIVQGFKGNVDEADLRATEGLAIATRIHDRFREAGFLLVKGELARVRGEWDSARQFSERGMSLTSSGSAFLALTAVLEHEAGHSSQGDTYLDQLLADLRKVPPEPSLILS